MKIMPRTLLCLPLLFALGCQTVDKIDPTSAGDVHDIREAREEKLVSEFEESRTEAQILAALASWEHGDASTAQHSLEDVLSRDATNREARLLLADLLAESGDIRKAENHLRLMLDHDPNDAQAHFSLGLLLENDSRMAEGMNHFQQALQLEPGNELFAMTASAISEDIAPAGYNGSTATAPYGTGCASGTCTSGCCTGGSCAIPVSYETTPRR